jgi:hypothetical protein
MISKIVRAASFVAAMTASFASPVQAYTQCQGNVEKIWAGDGGYLWIHLTNGGSTMIGPNDPNQKTVTAMAITALTASRQIVIRYQADGVNCSETNRSDFVGLYLL